MTTALNGIDGPLFLSVREFSVRMGVSVMHVHNLINAGRLKAISVGSVKRIPMAEFDRVQREGC